MFLKINPVKLVKIIISISKRAAECVVLCNSSFWHVWGLSRDSFHQCHVLIHVQVPSLELQLLNKLTLTTGPIVVLIGGQKVIFHNYLWHAATSYRCIMHGNDGIDLHAGGFRWGSGNWISAALQIKMIKEMEVKQLTHTYARMIKGFFNCSSEGSSAQPRK